MGFLALARAVEEYLALPERVAARQEETLVPCLDYLVLGSESALAVQGSNLVPPGPESVRQAIFGS